MSAFLSSPFPSCPSPLDFSPRYYPTGIHFCAVNYTHTSITWLVSFQIIRFCSQLSSRGTQQMRCLQPSYSRPPRFILVVPFLFLWSEIYFLFFNPIFTVFTFTVFCGSFPNSLSIDRPEVMPVKMPCLEAFKIERLLIEGQLGRTCNSPGLVFFPGESCRWYSTVREHSKLVWMSLSLFWSLFLISVSQTNLGSPKLLFLSLKVE